ncbi:MAG: ATP-dependent acyl-CoA ligase [Rhodospirillaceae bacterium]|nr:ATP-dependent acyl-CoA ligase [Rhodospirillaceae bacterium]
MIENHTEKIYVRGAGPAETVFELFRLRVAQFQNHPLFMFPESVRLRWDDDRSFWTYGETLDRVITIVERLRASGIGKGHRVALALDNRPWHFQYLLALNAVGASAVPINTESTQDEVTYLLGHSESCLLVALPGCSERFAHIETQSSVPVVEADVTSFPTVLHPVATRVGTSVDECAVIYTSGSTGRPKGCVLSNGYFLGFSDWYARQGGLMSLSMGSERLMTPLPGFHVNASCHSFMGMLGVGGAQVIIDRFHPGNWWQIAIETEATCFHYLGVIPAILLELPENDVDRRHGLRFGHGGGVHPDHHARFEERFGVPLLEGWTMTETGSATLHCSNEAPRHVGTRCIGRTPEGVDVRLIDDNGNAVSPGTPGLLLVRGNGDNPRQGFCSGYLKNQAATHELWAGGWLQTGDVMRQDADGYLYFVDRRKNIIRRSGENIAAIEVELLIADHPAVSKVAVVPTEDRLRDEEVFAAVVPASDAAPSPSLAQEIFDHCASKLVYFKLPGYIRFLDTLPMTPTQKVRKTELKLYSAQPLSSPDCHDFRDAKQALRPKA